MWPFNRKTTDDAEIIDAEVVYTPRVPLTFDVPADLAPPASKPRKPKASKASPKPKAPTAGTPSPASTSATAKRRRPIVAPMLVWIGFAAVLVALESLLINGQRAFGEHYLGQHGDLTLLVPVALEGGTLVSAGLGLWAMLSGDSYAIHRLWTGIFLAAAMLAGYLGTIAEGLPQTGALYIAGFSIAVLRFWHAILRRIKRDGHSLNFMRYPAVRWVLAPGETFHAWKTSHVDGLDPAEALAAVRGSVHVAAPAASSDAHAVDLEPMNKRQRVMVAAEALGTWEATPVVKWLGDRKYTVDLSYAAQILRTAQDDRRRDVARVVSGPVNGTAVTS